MSLGGGGVGVSPIRMYKASFLTDLFWATGELRSRGPAHFYINQEETERFVVQDGHLHPWSFTGLPAVRLPKLILERGRVHLLLFPDAETNAEYRKPPRRTRMVLYMPLCVVQGEVPLLSEAKDEDFLEFLKGKFVPITEASIHYLVEHGPMMPTHADLLFVHREHLVSYFPR